MNHTELTRLWTNYLSNVLYLVPVFIEDGVSWLGLVLHRLLVQSQRLLMHPPELQLLGPGHVQGSAPVTDPFAVNVGVQVSRVRVKARLKDRRSDR